MASSGFLPFRAGVTGWPSTPDDCVAIGCYCERFDLADVRAGRTGVRQPSNTWFNLYALGASLLAAIVLELDRSRGTAANVMRSSWWPADAYLFAMPSLGLGSMWLHASIAAAVSWMDGLSMYVFAAYLVLEFGYARIIQEPWAVLWWMLAVFAIVDAAIFWKLSDTGEPLCDPDSSFQPHGVVRHPLAGIMALAMFFYWRREGAGATRAAAADGTTGGSGGGWR